MRTLKLDDTAVGHVLDELDSRAEPNPSMRRKQGKRFPYRVRGVRVDFHVSRDSSESHSVITRNIGRQGVAFLTCSVVHVGTPCTIHLIGIQNNTQTADAKVTRCRYVQGTACVHEVDCSFERPVDPASFASTAIRARVLLADASSMSRRLLSHMLEPLNVDLACVDNGIMAVQRALSDPCDLILIDPVLPKLDGIKAVRFLRKKGYLRPICAVSSRTTSADREACLLAGFEEFLPKPPRREHIEAVIQRTRPQPLVSSLLHRADMRPLIDEFVLELLDRADKLEKSFATEDSTQLLEVAMGLKADAGGFGFEMITSAALDVEMAVANGSSYDELRPKLGRLVRLCHAARPATCDAVLDPTTDTQLDSDDMAGMSDEDGDMMDDFDEETGDTWSPEMMNSSDE